MIARTPSTSGYGDVGLLAPLFFRLGAAADRRDAREVAAQFTAEGVLQLGETIIRGRAAIAEFYAQRLADSRRKTRHVWTNLMTNFVDERSATVTAVLTNYAFEPTKDPNALQVRIGDVQARCALDESGSWRISEQAYEIVFAAAIPLAGQQSFSS